MVLVLGSHQIEHLPFVIPTVVSRLVRAKGNALPACAKEVPKWRFCKCELCSRMSVSHIVCWSCHTGFGKDKRFMPGNEKTDP
mmetsp:Transcript_4031/g.25343  ORF Transcript_4031/g.25343 Transcript_4031/m.25343 type:complete len:83 (-) Transcript_4031:1764-2012(-)